MPMLWYKAWRESRGRFLICAGIVAGMCILGVLFEQAGRRQLGLETYAAYIYKLTYSGMVRGLFSLFAGVLGLGGLQRERSVGTAGFTLVLPVSRLRLLTARATTGLCEVAVLSLLPAVVLTLLSPVVHEWYPASQALEFSALWFVFGANGFAAWFLASTLFASEFTALTVAVGIGFLGGLASQAPPLRGLNMSSNYLMSGYRMPWFNAHTSLLTGPLPWKPMLWYSVVTLAFISIAVRITQQRDFS